MALLDLVFGLMGQAEPTGGLGLTVRHRQVDPVRVRHGEYLGDRAEHPKTQPGQVWRRPTPDRAMIDSRTSGR